MADEQGIEISGLPEGHPPLMVFVEKPISSKDCERIRDTISQALRERRMVIIDHTITVYQMIDSRWQLIHSDA